MSCKSCQSHCVHSFKTEIAIHFPGLEGLDKPVVFIFPTLVVCMHCGFTTLSVSEGELQRLSNGLNAPPRYTDLGLTNHVDDDEA
jgi:hypothetical protein